MITEAVIVGYYHSEAFRRDYPKIQILTIVDLFNDKEVQMPTGSIAFRQAEKTLKSKIKAHYSKLVLIVKIQKD